MSAENQLKSSLNPVDGTFCNSCLKRKNVRFDYFGSLYREMEQLERSARRVKSVQQLLKGEFVTTSRLILLQIEIKLTIRYLEKKYKKV